MTSKLAQDMPQVLEDQCSEVMPRDWKDKTCVSLEVPVLPLQGPSVLKGWGGALPPGWGHVPETRWLQLSYRRCLVLLVISSVGGPFPL